MRQPVRVKKMLFYVIIFHLLKKKTSAELSNVSTCQFFEHFIDIYNKTISLFRLEWPKMISGKMFTASHTPMHSRISLESCLVTSCTSLFLNNLSFLW